MEVESMICRGICIVGGVCREAGGQSGDDWVKQ